MKKKNASGAVPWADPDDAPPLTAAHFADAAIYDGEMLARPGRGRPRLVTAKRQVTIRLDPDLLDRLRATGPGWHARFDDAVREWLQRHAT